MSLVQDITLTSLETITCFDPATGAYKFTLDELQSASIQNGQEKTDITGKGGRKLNSLKKNKTVTITGTNGLISGGLLETQVGSAFANKATNVMWTDYLTVNASHEATTTWKAVGTAGAEIKELYTKNADGSLNQKLEQAATASTGKFAYDPTTKKLTLHTDITAGTELFCIYDRKITADVLEDKSDVYSTKCMMYIDAMGEDKCANIYRVQFFVPKADFNGQFQIQLGGDQVVHEFEAESLAGACGTSGQLWTYTVFGANTPDWTE